MLKKRIFVVDDEPLIRRLIRDLLEARGYEVGEAEDCRAGLAGFRQFRPHLAIIDNVLPDGTGLEMLRTCKEIDATVPLILMTGYRYDRIEEKALEAGALRFLTKPFDLNLMLSVVEETLAPRTG